MSGDWDASIRGVHPTETGVVFAPIDLVTIGAAFDVVAAVRIGESLMSVVQRGELFLAVRNLSASTTLLHRHERHELSAQRATLHQLFRTTVDAGWSAADGDVLEILATFKATAGVHTDYSLARSDPFIAGAPFIAGD